MSGQLESRHYYQVRDTVQSLDGRVGTVESGFALFATIRWADGQLEEIEQFDPSVEVLERAGPT